MKSPRETRSGGARRRLPARLALLVTAMLALVSAGGAAPPAPEVWVELPAAGAGDLAVSAGGAEVTASDAGPLGDGWRVVVLFDLELSEPQQLRNGAIMLAERAAHLTALGPVEVVLARQGVRSTLPPTTSAPSLDETLAWIGVRESSRHLQGERRRDFAERSRPTLAAAEAAARAERDGLAAHLDRLLDWAAAEAAPGPQLLLYVGGGYEADPAAFYAEALRDGEDGGPELTPLPPLPSADELGRALAMLGWTVVAFQPPARGDALLAEAEESDTQRLERRFEEGRGLGQVAIGVGTRKLRNRDKESKRISVLADPVAPLAELAGQTGGELLLDPLGLADLSDRLRRRHTLRLDLAATSAEPLPVRVTAGGEPVAARRWIGSRLPRPVSAARARQLLRDELEEGDFWVEAVLEPAADGTHQLTLQLEPEAGLDRLRLTLAALDEGGALRVVHQALDPAAAVDGAIRLALPPSLATVGDEPLAVLVEDAGGVRRGATFASLRAAPTSGAEAGPIFQAAEGRLLRLLPPESAMVIGPTLFRTLVDERAVTRVEFYLDGELAVDRAAAPFSARLDLGPLPRTRRVLAVAYGGGGGELARDSVLVNGGSGLLEVRIVEPETAEAGSADAPLVGPVEVRADVRVPEGARLDRVEFFWRDRLVATRYAPPFRERIEVAPESPRGFVRVLARLADGSSGEDVVFLNSPGPSERLDIDLVELYTVVTDRQGNPVTDLPPQRFRVFEDGRPMEIATFGDGGELPLTVGLAIDSSASMFVKLPRVQRSARQFVGGLESRRDRAFVVGFGSRPRLARTPTSDLPQVVQALDRLSPNGQTAIWEAVAFSLVQLQGVPGKKALIVYSDGADEDQAFYRTSLKFARTVGAPVYFILSNNEIVRTGGKGLSVRGFLGRLRELTEEVGGRVYLTRVGDDLDDVYRQIAEELESQYFIGYYSEQGDGQEWRKLKVDVKGVGLEARTISGFYR